MLRPEDFRRLTLGEFEPKRPEPSPGAAQVARYVEAVSAQHNGGTGYFNRLDSLIGRDPAVLGSMVELAQEKFGTNVSLVVTGGFGMDYRDWAQHTRQRRPALWLPGGLRYRGEPSWPDVNDARRQLIGTHFDVVLLDDSLYKGRTMQYVRELVLSAGRRFMGAVVAYDGSRAKQPDVHSLYRYFDHFVPE